MTLFTGQHILSVAQFTPEHIDVLFNTADRLLPYARRERVTNVLEGAILNSLFFEPSTRTRVSFGCAFNLLGGHVRETTEIKTSSLAKGESLYDTAKVLSGYSDIMVMRHPMEGSVQEFAQASRVPVINGGDGSNEHPSQALLDLYTIRNELARHGAKIHGMRIAMVGDLAHGRTVHSLSRLLSLYRNITFVFISPKALCMPIEIVQRLIEAGHEVIETESLEEGLADVDIVYQTRIQEERFPSQLEAEKYKGAYRINRFVYSQFCQPTTVIMHPMPRDARPNANELDADLNEHPNLAIFRQADNGVVIRMALFAEILGVADQVESKSRPVNWYTGKRF
ncbi:MAG: aspartate carbamoyltransferase [Gammaproteobacteria bacterium]|nr:MAG: aspartate carbamoyltransferase [Gammaproteobacteria bacterium]